MHLMCSKKSHLLGQPPQTVRDDQIVQDARSIVPAL